MRACEHLRSAGLEALFFDVFGTLVDWRTSVAREAERILEPLGYTARLGRLRRRLAGRIPARHGGGALRPHPVLPSSTCCTGAISSASCRASVCSNLSDEVLHELTLAWHRLDAWPDVPAALARLKTQILLAPVSNGNISLMVDLARRNEFPVGRHPRRRDRRRLQAEAARLSRRLRGARSGAGAMHDGGGALERSRRRRAMRPAHRRTPRASTNTARTPASRADGAGRLRGQGFGGSGGQLGG